MIKKTPEKTIVAQKKAMPVKACPFQKSGCLKYLRFVGLYKNRYGSTCGNKFCLKAYHKERNLMYKNDDKDLTKRFHSFLKRHSHPVTDYRNGRKGPKK